MFFRRRVWRERVRGWPRRWIAVVAAFVVLAGTAAGWTAVASDSGGGSTVHRQDRMMPMGGGVRIDTSYFTAGDPSHKRPAVLLTHGFGGSKADVRAEAEQLAAHGYAVMTWSSRGFGRSGGKIGLNDPKHEVADVSRMIDWLAKRPEVELDKPGDPRVGVTGASYGGAVSLLAAGHDKRVDAVAPQITYWNLADALFPDGVFKKLWAGAFFTSGSAQLGTRTSEAGLACGRFEKKLCDMYKRVAVSGKPDAEARKLLEERSPVAVGDRIKVPTFIAQGQTDSLFPLSQADEIARHVKANGAPVEVDWLNGGHDGGDMEVDRLHERVTSWFDRYLKDENVDTGPAFRVTRTGGVDSTDGAATLRGASGDLYPGLRGEQRVRVPLKSATETFQNPPGGGPPSISSVPGLGQVANLSASLGGGFSLEYPGQFARFDSAPLKKSVRVTGSPTVTAHVKSSSGTAVLFAKVYDAGPDGARQVLPSQLVTPVKVTGADGAGKDVKITLPAVDHEVQKGHKLRLVLSATDLGYASPNEPATYQVSMHDKSLSVPTAPDVKTAATPLPGWVWWLPAGAVVLAAGLLFTARRRTTAPAPDPALAEVPLQITDLSKKYAGSSDRYAVRELSFRVERGQVLGLLGPNGAGKTTTLRMLMGLIRPDGGEIRVFGHAIRPGSPVLSRVGAFVEGAGFLPHLSGRENLELYWKATGRPAEDAHLDEALEIAGLGDALARAVRTYSQGMRQRLAIAQAMLGLPELLILDEPTNGLDPPQIREMREVMIRYARGGRTVIVSSHLLAEVEQTCTHLVVMDRGRLVQAGPVADIVGSGDTLLVGVAGEVSDALVEKVSGLAGVASVGTVEDGLLVRLVPEPDTSSREGDPASQERDPAARLLAELVRLDVPVRSMGPHRRLEDAFLTLIGGASA
ncbi:MULTISPECIES: alpha/beta fold hydrolase [unclassified Streptomyces]|uniref:alpha/beta fold hydrolase n=1 Tax=unclassified Streptomyces TaxID=2593676 RepID=UPI00278C5B1A|nr:MULTISPECIES: alpha/beta fold hydrolase [unclassified Streptomyces]